MEGADIAAVAEEVADIAAVAEEVTAEDSQEVKELLVFN